MSYSLPSETVGSYSSVLFTVNTAELLPVRWMSFPALPWDSRESTWALQPAFKAFAMPLSYCPSPCSFLLLLSSTWSISIFFFPWLKAVSAPLQVNFLFIRAAPVASLVSMPMITWLTVLQCWCEDQPCPRGFLKCYEELPCTYICVPG